MADIQPFTVDATEAELEHLRERLRATRWPDAETPDDWSQGVPIAYAREFCEYWANEYNWSERQDRLNSFAQFTTSIDDLQVHFIHVQSPVSSARPIVITHGWPGSVVEFLKVIGPLADPEAHGGEASDAFHVVCPSLPGYGYSGKPAETGYGVAKIAGMWEQLMQALGYDAYFAQGGDWGAAVTTAIALQNLGHCKGIHLNMPSAGATKDARENPTDEDKHAMERGKAYQDWDSGYSKQQSTRPQTLGYGLADSPAGQAMWILEKFWRWTDCQGHPENVLTRDELIDNIMLYWLTNSAASSARLYWESFARAFGGSGNNSVTLPTGCSIFPQEIVPTPRSWAERRYPNIVYWNELEAGGHFAAFEQPELFVAEMRNCFRKMR
jgi:pimeloyl-ACP methyl ester carboxylesterase|tara:strand:- start:1700 stop:2848 length:1149 start_codon:yes stop_codon:yes gene_type:complete